MYTQVQKYTAISINIKKKTLVSNFLLFYTCKINIEFEGNTRTN